jgi:HTH-type transcriptional regulator/antitoxin HigA
MNNKSIKSESEYNEFIIREDQLFDAPKGTEQSEELDRLVLLVNKYEEENFPIDEPDSKEYRKIRMQERV